ncbi:MAG: 50S ribosomal protein L4 [Acidimicrobiales bacterium]
MPSVAVKSASGSDVGTVDLDEEIFGIEPNIPVMHQVVTAQLAAKRSGTQSTKTRAEVRGGGAKPWKQKGTGRARQGSIRSPQWRGGGVALGPKPRSYAQKTPKKMKRLALRSALSDRAADGKVVIIDDWGFDSPKTGEARKKLAAIGAEGRVLVVIDRSDETAWLSFRNIPEVHVLTADQLNTYDVLVSDVVVFTRAALPTSDVAATAAPAVAEAVIEESPDRGETGGDDTADAEGDDELGGSASGSDTADAEGDDELGGSAEGGEDTGDSSDSEDDEE